MTLRTPWLAITAMFILNGALFGVWASRVPAVADIYGLNHTALGLTLLALAGGAVCSFPFAGRAVDRVGAATVTRSLALIYPVTLILLPLAPGAWTLTVFLFLFGAAHGAMDVAMNSWAAEVERRAGRPFMSGFHAMFSLGAGLGALSGYLAVQAGLGLLPHFMICAVAVTAMTWTGAQIPWHSDTATPEKTSVFALPKGALMLVGLVAFCASMGEGAMTDWSALYLRDVVEVTEAKAALGYVVFSVAMVIVRLLGDAIVARLGPVRSAQLGGCIAACGMVMVIAAPVLNAVLVGFAMLGIGYAVVMPLAFSRAANDPHVPPGRAISGVATLGYGGLLLGPPTIGFVAGAFGLQVAFALLGVLAGLSVALAKSLR